MSDFKKFENIEEVLKYILKSTEIRSLLYARKVASHYIQSENISMVDTTNFEIALDEKLQSYVPSKEVSEKAEELNKELKKLFGNKFNDNLSEIANAMIKIFEPDTNQHFLETVDVDKVTSNIEYISSTITELNSRISALTELSSFLDKEGLQRIRVPGVELFLDRIQIPLRIPTNIYEIEFFERDCDAYWERYPHKGIPEPKGFYNITDELEKFATNLKNTKKKMKKCRNSVVSENESNKYKAILCLYGIFATSINKTKIWGTLPFEEGNFDNITNNNREEILAVKFVYQITELLNLNMKPITIWKIVTKFRGERKKNTNTRNGKNITKNYRLTPVSYERFEGNLYYIERDHSEYQEIEYYPKEDPWMKIDSEIKKVRPKTHKGYEDIIHEIFFADKVLTAK